MQDCPSSIRWSTALTIRGMYCRYVEVDEEHGARLFYYFIASERNPAEDPLILWITGGPGCSALSGLLFEIGQ